MKKYPSTGIPSWAVEDRPREKFLTAGARGLSDTELLAIIISSGTSNQTAVDLARQLLRQVDYDLERLSRISVGEMSRMKGIGPAKAVKILSALELGSRKHQVRKPDALKITSSRDVFVLFGPLIGNLQHEEFWIVILNRANHVITRTRISQGGLSGTVIDTRLILKNALEHLASSIIACHNHPSGNRQPSEADRRITSGLKKSAELMEIKFLDHIIIAGDSYYSFADEGMID